MTIQYDTGNHTGFEGRVVEVHEYSKGKAANITISVENRLKNGTVRSVNIQTKCFNPAMYNAVKTGMLVHLYGHVTPGSYVKDGLTVYTQDLVTDYIKFLESKAVVEAREAARSVQKNAYEVDFDA